VPPFHSYVALGDSFTEGVGDPDLTRPNGVRGWADRAAEVMADHDPDFRYANLAIRGRKMRRLRDAGTHLVLFTGFDLGWAPIFGLLRGRVADVAWARSHAAPWVQRRWTGRSAGDGLRPRLPELTPVGPDGPRRSGTI
jgi:hypothetical protein